MIHKSTYREQVVNYLHDAILRGDLKPGERITECSLAKKLNISRAPIREAFQQLIQEGLIESKSQVGKYIATLTSREIYESYVISGVLEGYALGESISLFKEKDFKIMEKICSRMSSAAKKKKEFELSALDRQFHELLFSKTTNQMLVELSKKANRGAAQILLRRHWRRVFTPEEIYDRHIILIEALREGDSRKIEILIRDHYAETGKRLSAYSSDLKNN